MRAWGSLSWRIVLPLTCGLFDMCQVLFWILDKEGSLSTCRYTHIFLCRVTLFSQCASSVCKICRASVGQGKAKGCGEKPETLLSLSSFKALGGTGTNLWAGDYRTSCDQVTLRCICVRGEVRPKERKTGFEIGGLGSCHAYSYCLWP